MSAEADQYGNDLRAAKTEISELTRMISRLQSEILSAKAQVGQRLMDGSLYMMPIYVSEPQLKFL